MSSPRNSIASTSSDDHYMDLELQSIDNMPETISSELCSLSTRSCLGSSHEFFLVENNLQALDSIFPGFCNTPKQISKGLKRPKSKKGQNELRVFKRISKPKKNKQSQHGTEKEPKKEYVRVKLIRGHKRVIRKIISGVIKPPTTTINKIERNNSEQFEAWKIFVNNTEANSSELKEICLTYNGPLTDGKSYRKEKSKGERGKQEKTFNNTFSKEYFSRTAILENFKLYVDYLFASQSSQSLKTKFKFYCCKINACKTCTDKWERLHVFIRDFLTTSPSFDDYADDELDENNEDRTVFENDPGDIEGF